MGIQMKDEITVIRALNDLALASTASIPLTPPDTA